MERDWPWEFPMDHARFECGMARLRIAVPLPRLSSPGFAGESDCLDHT